MGIMFKSTFDGFGNTSFALVSIWDFVSSPPLVDLETLVHVKPRDTRRLQRRSVVSPPRGGLKEIMFKFTFGDLKIMILH